MKKSLSLFELLFVVLIISFVSYSYKINPNLENLEIATQKLVFYLKYTRYQALIDNQYDNNDPLWHKKRWTLKFFNCSKNIGGIYYSIYSDKNKKGHPNLKESLKDPLTNKYIYSSNKCKETYNTSKYVLLTKQFDIEKIDISCNSTSGLGQISFGNRTEIYTKLSPYENKSNKYQLMQECIITLFDSNLKSKKISVSPITGYIEQL